MFTSLFSTRAGARVVLFLALLAGVFSLIPTRLVLAAGVVGTGTAESCTQSALYAAMVGGGQVTFNCGTDPVTIPLTSELEIENTVAVDGDEDITLQAKGVQPFSIQDTGALTLQELTLTDAGAPKGFIENRGTLALKNVTARRIHSENGAIWNYGTLTVENSLFTHNASSRNGGGINNYGHALIKSSRFEDNKADSGGAIASFSDDLLDIRSSVFVRNQASSGGALLIYGTIKIKNSEFRDNRGTSHGGAILNYAHTTITLTSFEKNLSDRGAGAIANYGSMNLLNVTVRKNHGYFTGGAENRRDMTIERSTFSENTSDNAGGALTNYSNLNIFNSTLSGNSGGKYSSAGGLYASGGTANLTFVTIANNTGEDAGGIAASKYNNATIMLVNTILANTDKNCGEGKIVSQGNNLSSDRSCSALSFGTDKTGVDAKLGPLADNGGYTETHLLLAGSPAITAGRTVDDIKIDQRGFDRPKNNPDMGAVEVAPN